jgi:hypothetical protein
MKSLLALLFRGAKPRANKTFRRSALALEQLEDRLIPAGNILATVAGPYPQHLFQEYTPTGTLVRSVNIPATPGSNFDYARDLVEDPSGKVYVYNGTFTPYLAAYNPTTNSWSQSTYPGWSTVSNVSYGGLAEFGNYLYASDMATAGAMPNGVVRFNLADGSATRFGNVDFTELNIGLDGKLYALSGATSTIYVYDPISTALLRTVALPSADYRAVAANASGDLFTVAWNNVISHFNSNGALLSSITLNSSTGAPFMYNFSDEIDMAPDGTLAIGTFSGYIARMTSAFTNISYINTGTNNQVFVTFAPQPAQPTISVSDTTVTSPTSGMVQAPFVVSLSAPSSTPVTVNFTTVNGSATAPNDYWSASGTLTFAPGQTSQTLYINVQADPYWDPSETFSLVLSNPNGATLAKSQGTATINSSLPTPTFSINNVTVTNVASGTTQAIFTVRLSEPLSDPYVFGYSTADVTARAGSDYQAASGYVNFAPGQTNQTVTVNVIGDPYYDSPEIFNLNLLPPGGGSPMATGTATIVSGVPMPSASVNDVTVQNTASGTTATFTVTLSAPSNETATVGYSTASGTATVGSDYQSASNTLTFAPGQTSQTVTVNVIGDPYFDGNETFYLNLLSPSGATIARGQGTGTILSTLPPPTISVSNVTVTNVTSGLTQAIFTVSLSQPLSDPASVYYTTADGTATAGSDYQAASGYVNFSPGQTSQTVSVNVIGDAYYDPTETFNLNLLPVSVGGPSSPYASGTATIVSSLSRPTLSVSNATVYNSPSATTPMSFTVTLSGPSSDPVTVNYATADGTALAGTDYQAASGTLTFAPGQTSQTITVSALANPLAAPPVTFTVNLSGASGAAIAQGQGTGTIINSQGSAYVNIGGVYVTDVDSGTTPANFWVWVSPGSSVPVTVNYATVDGTAVAGTDYVATSGTLTFAPGQTGQYITVSILGNPNYAPGRSFSVVLSNPQNARMGSQGGNCTIFDDAPIANIGPNTTVNEGSPVQFDASGSRDLDGDPLTFSWNFGDGNTGTGSRPTHVYTESGIYTATVSVSDGSAVTTASETVTVLAVAPTAAVSGPSDAVRGQTRTFTFSASEPSPGDQAAPFTYQINWGDGSTQTVQGSGSGLQVSHVFTSAGTSNLSVTATDEDGNTGPAASQAVAVFAAELQGPDLVVGGTTGNDVITVQPADANGTVDVVINGQDQGTFVPTGQVVVYGQSGNDTIQVVPLSANGSTIPLSLPVMLFAGSGNDTLDARGASGPTVLVGGGGNNTMYGGSGRNILIAGSGSSVLHGGTDDLLIAGTTSFDHNLTALAALRAEWSRTDVGYPTRIADLSGTQTGGLNGSYLLTSQTVTSNGGGNSLYGGSGQAWFFAASSDSISNLLPGEVVTSL